MVSPVPHPLEEPLLVNPEVCYLAPVPTQCPQGQTLRMTYQPRLREAFPGMSGDLTEINEFEELGQTPPLEHRIQTRGWTSTSAGL